MAGRVRPEPLVLHAAAGECLTVHFTNRRKAGPEGPAPRASFHVAKLDRTPESAGVNVGYDPEAHGRPRRVADLPLPRAVRLDRERRDRRLRRQRHRQPRPLRGGRGRPRRRAVRRREDRAPPRRGRPGRRAPAGRAQLPRPHAPVRRRRRRHRREHDAVPERRVRPRARELPQRAEGRRRVDVLVTRPWRPGHADPDRVPGRPAAGPRVGAPGSEQGHVFSLGGLAWRPDERLPKSAIVTAQGFAAWETIEASPLGGAGGWSRSTGDMFWGDLRRPFTEAGMWGLLRTVSDAKCPVRPLPGRDCIGEGPIGSSPATPTTPGTAPTTGTIRAGTQPLQPAQPVTPITTPAPRTATRGSAASCCRRALEDAAAPRRAARRDRADRDPDAAGRAATGRVEVGRGRDRAGHPPRGRGGDDLALPARTIARLRTGGYVVSVGAGSTGPRLTARMTLR